MFLKYEPFSHSNLIRCPHILCCYILPHVLLSSQLTATSKHIWNHNSCILSHRKNLHFPVTNTMLSLIHCPDSKRTVSTVGTHYARTTSTNAKYNQPYCLVYMLKITRFVTDATCRCAKLQTGVLAKTTTWNQYRIALVECFLCKCESRCFGSRTTAIVMIHDQALCYGVLVPMGGFERGLPSEDVHDVSTLPTPCCSKSAGISEEETPNIIT